MLAAPRGASQQGNRAKQLLRVVPVLLVVAVLTVFMPAVGFEFTNYDEPQQLVANPYIRGLSLDNLVDIFTHFSITSYYPIRLLSFAIDYEFWDLKPTGYHLTNVLIHLVNVLVLFHLGLRLAAVAGTGVGRHALEGAGMAPAESRSRKSKREQGGRPSPASVPDPRSAIMGGVAGALFGLHPVVVEPVAWVAGREELLMVLFTLGCVHFHVSAGWAADQSGKAGQGGWGRVVLFHVLAGICCAFACMSNVVGAIIPAIVVAYDVTVARNKSVRRVAGGTWFLLAIATGTIILKQISEKIALAKGGPGASGGLTIFSGGLAVVEGYGHNLRTLLWPRGLIVRYPNILSAGFFEPSVLLGTALVLLTPLLLWCVRRQRLASFGLLWFLLGLAPSSQVIPHHILCADRFLYLPLAGLSLAVAVGILHLPRPGIRMVVTVTGTLLVLGALAARSALQVQVWRNSVVLWSHCIRWNPREAQAYYNRGLAYAENGNYDRALTDYNKAIQFKPDYTDAYNNRGLLYASQGQYDRAIAEYSKAIAVECNYAKAYNNRGVAYGSKRNYDHALADFTKAISLEPNNAKAYSNRGTAYYSKGRYHQARQDFEQALRLDPSGPAGRAGQHYLQRLGETDY